MTLPCVPDDYNTKEMCEVVVLEFPHVLKFVSDQHKMQEMYEELLRGSCIYLRIILDLFVTAKVLKHHVNDKILDTDDKFIIIFNGYKQCKAWKENIDKEFLPKASHPLRL